MRKSFLFIFFLFFTIKTFGCRCGSQQNIAQDYFESDFVGVITITKTYGDSLYIDKGGQPREFYKADFIINKIIKGKKFSTLNAFGVTKDEFGIHSMDCSISFFGDSKYLVVLKKNNKNEYWVDSCSRMVWLGFDKKPKEQTKEIYKYVNLFENLEKYKNQFSDLKFDDLYDKSSKMPHYPDTPFLSDFAELTISNPHEKIGIYKIFIDKNLNVKQLIPIKRVGEKDIEIEKLILKNLHFSKYWKSINKSDKSLLLLYFRDFEPIF